MIKLEHVVLVSPEQMKFIIEGIRNRNESWDKSDSSCGTATRDTNVQLDDNYFIGTNDAILMQRLSNSGVGYINFMRMMPVYVRITAPLYWWKDFDDLPSAYTIGVFSDDSDMIDRIAKKEFTIENFSCEYLTKDSKLTLFNIIRTLNKRRLDFINPDAEKEGVKKEHWWQMIQLLPDSYNQTRNVMLNYEVLMNIYRCKHHHYLDEWDEFCKWIEELPYSELIVKNKWSDYSIEKTFQEPIVTTSVDNSRGAFLWQPGDED